MVENFYQCVRHVEESPQRAWYVGLINKTIVHVEQRHSGFRLTVSLQPNAPVSVALQHPPRRPKPNLCGRSSERQIRRECDTRKPEDEGTSRENKPGCPRLVSPSRRHREQTLEARDGTRVAISQEQRMGARQAALVFMSRSTRFEALIIVHACRVCAPASRALQVQTICGAWLP